MSRVLVTGASGFVGRNVLAPLLDAGYEVDALTASSSAPPPDAPARVRWHRAKLLDAEQTAALVTRLAPSHLMHFAWNVLPGYPTALENLDWVGASLRLLRAFGEAGGRRAVVSGTCFEYEQSPRMHCVENHTPVRPSSLYGAAKHGLHIVAEAWARQTGVSFAWGRIFYLYGPHEYPGRLVSSLAQGLLRGEEVACSHGRQVRDFLYVPELGEAFTALLHSEVTGTVNMASGTPVSVAEVIAAVAEAAGHPELVRLGARPTPPGEPEAMSAEVRRLREEVGWSSTIGLLEGARRTVDWWRRAQAEERAGTWVRT
jgi:nucleoside-diphosphate-sugar epimerase